MALAPGSRLGPYEIVSLLGAGGMGEVYRARDTRLDRSVAVKILPAALATDPELHERFGREARAISQLTHPHICTLHDIGDEDGIAYLVMELLDGQTLADRLDKGALPFDEAMRVAIEVCRGIDAAHRAGIVHRDLKPANVMLTKSGAKLLDFGLAKTHGPAVVANGLSMLPTTPPNITAQGAILGTFQYMAPEQIEGVEADARTDIFAFGCVLHELFTGEKAFDGRTRASLIGAILKDQPRPLSQRQPLATPALVRAVKTCLEKDPDDRWQSARDLLRELEWAGAPAATVGPAAAAVARGRTRRGERFAWLAAIVALAAALVVVWLRSSPPPKRPPVRLSISVPGAPVNQARQAVAVSPDGRTIVYRGGAGPATQLFLRRLDAFDPVPMRGTSTADGPFFSPDGDWVGFFADGKLKKAPLSGGPVATICDASQGAALGAAWLADNTIVLTMIGQPGLLRVSADGGNPEPLAGPDASKNERSYRWPSAIPGRRAIAFALVRVGTGSDDAEIAVRNMDSGEQHIVQHALGTRPQVLASGHLVTERGGSLQVMPFDLRRLQSTGAAVPMIEGVAQSPANGGLAGYDVSPAGTLVYLPGTLTTAERTLTWVDRSGATHDIPSMHRPISEVALSRDGRHAALIIDAPNGSGTDVWVYDFDRGGLTRLTFGEGIAGNPLWARDGRRVLYSSFRNGTYHIYSRPADGTGSEELLFKPEVAGNFPRAWSPDGRLLYQRGTGALTNDLWVFSPFGSHEHRPFIATPFNEVQGDISPDGHWVAYQSNESGRDEIFVRPFPDGSGKWQVSFEGGTRPKWTANGRELVFRSGDRLMTAAVTTAATFASAVPSELFDGAYATSFDATANGQRFLMIKGGPAGTQSEVKIVLDWFTELAAKVPGR